MSYNEIGTYNYSGALTNDTIHSIITYNIGYLSGMTNNLPIEKPYSLFDQNLNKVIYELKKSEADIVCFQEIDFDSKRSFHIDQQRELAKLGYPFFGKNINWDKKYVPFPYYPFSMHFGKILSGQSVLSKFPIIEQERIELKRNPNNPFYYDSFYLDRLAQVTKVKIEGRTVVLINVHLEAFDPSTRKEQFRQIKNLYLRYAAKLPTILLGDFNSDINYEDAGINILLEMPRMGCASFDPENFENTYNSESPSERLDYIFYNEEFITEVEAKVLAEFETASDHLPLLMKFKFKNQLYASIRQQPNP
ncbi:endonuclease/exonuclease/phosphatase family protein [Lutimonas zeaxanthinifaciens]|uniref:endonuclease/exonuclease/phosphatase family protein n=1 Tax=Lutimonas zeaxanthinifaciens TaxID=3060215 RepID=UPI00265CD61C|nr:endonuclease/exonuclease/phosphatase family protein [Lutimonas sp. YSD2104]WKK65302.1 endonuclease/exonuclease/phosphatase family protein [Lutimonas sp. YSD2104]